ncbi:MAG: hypothetical protein OXQ94_16900 [Gemmatimonadota bacterium]|nr:hypothetical protein [Gemmatimonadota bacterium]MDE2873358.1 hypothetical protein [Gemmatimonadota bacterium]
MILEWRGAELLLIGTLTLTSGCSLALVDGPPDFIPADQPIPRGACTIDRTLPLMDAIGAGTLLFVAATSSEGDRVRFGAVLGGALGYSAYSGFRSVKRCRERMLLRPEPPPSPDTTMPWSWEPHHLQRTRPGESKPAGSNG